MARGTAYEARTCALDGCDVVYVTTKTHPRRYCSAQHAQTGGALKLRMRHAAERAAAVAEQKARAERRKKPLRGECWCCRALGDCDCGRLVCPECGRCAEHCSCHPRRSLVCPTCGHEHAAAA